MTEDLRDALLADIDQWAPPTIPLQPGEVTVDDYMRAHPTIGRQRATRTLDVLVEEGKLEKLTNRVRNKRRVNAYRRVEE